MIEYLKQKDNKKNLKLDLDYFDKNMSGGILPFVNEFEENPIEKTKRIRSEKIEKGQEAWEEYYKNNFKLNDEEDPKFKTFLYNKGMSFPTNEMNREFYLRQRLNKVERNNLLKIIKGFSNFMLFKKRYIHFAVFGIGTSTYDEKYFDDLKKEFFNKGLSLDSEVIEKADSIAQQGFHFKKWEDFVEFCFNVSPAYDEKIRPMSKKKFYERLAKEQKRYIKKKTLREIINNKGEDLDFAICLEENYGSGLKKPLKNYNFSGKDSFGFFHFRDIDNLKKYFVQFLGDEKIKFKEEIDMLSGAEYYFKPNGKLIRQKDILDNSEKVSTYRLFFDEGREFHFYFYNSMADMWVKEERIAGRPFVQIERFPSYSKNSTIGMGNDLEAAIKYGEETGIFENPLILKLMK